MPNMWVEFVKDFSAKNMVSYGCAISMPEVKEGYKLFKQKLKPEKKEGKKPKKRRLKVIEDVVVEQPKPEVKKPDKKPKKRRLKVIENIIIEQPKQEKVKAEVNPEIKMLIEQDMDLQRLVAVRALFENLLEEIEASEQKQKYKDIKEYITMLIGRHLMMKNFEKYSEITDDEVLAIFNFAKLKQKEYNESENPNKYKVFGINFRTKGQHHSSGDGKRIKELSLPNKMDAFRETSRLSAKVKVKPRQKEELVFNIDMAAIERQVDEEMKAMKDPSRPKEVKKEKPKISTYSGVKKPTSKPKYEPKVKYSLDTLD